MKVFLACSLLVCHVWSAAANAQVDPTKLKVDQLTYWSQVSQKGPLGYLSIPPAAKKGGFVWVYRKDGAATGAITVEGGLPPQSGGFVSRFVPRASAKFWESLLPASPFDPLKISPADHAFFQQLEKLLVTDTPRKAVLVEPPSGDWPPIFAQQIDNTHWKLILQDSGRLHEPRVIEAPRSFGNRLTFPQPLLKALQTEDASGWSLIGLGQEGIVMKKGAELKFGYCDPNRPTAAIMFQAAVPESKLRRSPPDWVLRIPPSITRITAADDHLLSAALAVCSPDTWKRPQLGAWKADPEIWLLAP